MANTEIIRSSEPQSRRGRLRRVAEAAAISTYTIGTAAAVGGLGTVAGGKVSEVAIKAFVGGVPLAVSSAGLFSFGRKMLRR